MKFGIFNAAGDMLRVGDCAPGDVSLQAQPGEILFTGECTIHDRLNVATGELIVNGKPPRPSPVHEWDNTAKVWVANLAKAREIRGAEIEAARDAIIKGTILYDGKNIDCDTRSQDNVSYKLATIAQREALGLSPLPAELLVWRDADNITHSFANQTTYKNWLGGLAVAMDERGTLAYGWSWGQKAALAALTTYEDIMAYVITPP